MEEKNSIQHPFYFFMIDFIDGYYLNNEAQLKSMLPKKAEEGEMETLKRTNLVKGTFIDMYLKLQKTWDYTDFSIFLESLLQAELNCYVMLLFSEELENKFPVNFLTTTKQGYYSSDNLPDLLFFRFSSVYNPGQQQAEEVKRRLKHLSFESLLLGALPNVEFDCVKFTRFHTRAEKMMLMNVRMIERWKKLRKSSKSSSYREVIKYMEYVKSQKILYGNEK